MKKTKVKEIRENKWKIEGELVLKEGKVYVPKDEELRVEVIQLHYNVLAVGHRCYKLKSLELDNRTTLILSNTRELNRDPFTK